MYPSQSSSVERSSVVSRFDLPIATSVPIMARRVALCGVAASLCSALFLKAADARPRASRIQPAAAPVANSNEENLPGAWAWTTGEQTYLRVRPGIQTPIVAKVPHRTRMFVWGKYNGWYRVETVDHKFGWVYHEYLNCPKADKIKQLTQEKARLASNKGGRQKLYGSPELMQKYFARYGGNGAGHKVTRSNRVARTIVPSPSVKTSAIKVQAPKVQAPARVAARPVTPKVVAPVIRPAVAPSQPARTVVATVVEKVPGSRNLAPTLPQTSSSYFVKRHPSATPDSRMSRNATADNATTWSRSQVDAYNGGNYTPAAATLPDSTKPEVAVPASTPRAVKPVVRKAVAPKPVVQKVEAAKVETPKVVAPKVVAPKVVAVAPRPVIQAAPQPVAPKPVVNSVVPVAKPVVKEVVRPVATPAARPNVVQAPAKPKRLTRSQIRAQRRQQRLLASRNRLRARMGLNPRMRAVPPLATKGVHPISPEELMRAREEFLTSRYKTQPTLPNPLSNTPAPGVQTPSSLFDAPTVQPSGFVPGSSVVPDSSVSGSELTSRSFLSSLRRGPSAPMRRVVCKPVKAAGKPAAKAPAGVSRGGSPRDYARYNQSQGQGMASQALTYRGMPYIRGASSPNRGFDCSGLIFYLLRQRGYNPPRTAAGMASVGKPVSRGELAAGDIVLFANTYKRGISHVGVYVGEDKFVHAANSNSGVRVDSLSSGYYGRKYWGARRVK
jgi:cell wall-associated NlpC family hydrolase